MPFSKNFTFSAFEIAKSYQNSYSYAIAAIGAGLAAPEQKFSFFQKLTPKLNANLLNKLNSFIFKNSRRSAEQNALRKQLIENIKRLSKLPPIFSATRFN